MNGMNAVMNMISYKLTLPEVKPVSALPILFLVGIVSGVRLRLDFLQSAQHALSMMSQVLLVVYVAEIVLLHVYLRRRPQSQLRYLIPVGTLFCGFVISFI